MSEEDDRFFESESPTVLARRRTHVFSGVTVSSGLGLLGTYSEQVTSGHHENIVTLGSQELFGGSAPGQRPRGSTIVHASSENNLTSPYSHCKGDKCQSSKWLFFFLFGFGQGGFGDTSSWSRFCLVLSLCEEEVLWWFISQFVEEFLVSL